jgi:hypothetical protein
MKQNTSYNRAIQYLNKVFKLVNNEFFDNVFCKPFLQEVAKRFCRLLHLHFVGDCRRLCRPELAGRAPSQTSFTVTV